MRKLLIFLIFSSLSLHSCSNKVWGDDAMSTQEYEMSSVINEIEVQTAMQLNLSNSIDPGTLMITANTNIHKYITVSRQEDRVVISMDSYNYKNVEVTVWAAAAQYNSVTASGASSVTKGSNMGDFTNFSIVLSGASSFSGYVMVKNKLSVDIKGASSVSITGSADDCEVNSAGASAVYGYGFECDDLDVVLSGASTVEMTVHETIEGELSGASMIYYVESDDDDDTQVNVTLRGGSSVIQK